MEPLVFLPRKYVMIGTIGLYATERERMNGFSSIISATKTLGKKDTFLYISNNPSKVTQKKFPNFLKM
jgi:hypothetical protein